MGSLYSYVHVFPAWPGLTSLLFQAGLFSAVLTAFVVPKIQDLSVNPADQSVYYQNQTVQILDRISQQFASADGQISTNYTPPSPYQTFHPSASDRRVNILWLISLICSLSAAFLATLVQQWARDYMRIFTSPRKPLKTARIRMFLFERVERLPKLAEVVPGLIHFSLILFFWGIGEIILHIDKTIFITTVAPILVGAFFYLYCVFAPMWNPQLPYRTPFSVYIFNLIQNLRSHASMEILQENSAMKASDGRMNRDVRALRWLIDNIKEINEVQTFVLAFIDSFNEKWVLNVWRAVFGDDQSTSPVDQLRPGRPSPREGTTAYRLCTYVRLFLEKERNSTDMDVRRTGHTRECIETMASLVCLTDVELGSFGQVGEVLSEVGEIEQTNDTSTRLNPLFTVRWTCLSLVAIKQIVNDSQLQEVAKFTLDRIARLQTDYGDHPDIVVLMAMAQRIDDYLTRAWASVVDLHLAFDSEPRSLSRTDADIITILNSREGSISELERIANEAVGMEDVDWHFTFLLDTMDETTHKLMQRLPGVFFNKLKSAAPIMISEAFDFPSVVTTPVPPLLIFPGQQIQTLCNLGRRLRDIIEGQNTGRHEETLKSLESLREIPDSLRGLNYFNLMKRQLWRLLDLRDGRGFGFTIELFFLALRQLELSSTSPSSELKKVFYIGTFKAITSDWKDRKNSVGTQRILLDLLCDLVILSRGAFSNFPYPPYIVDMLLELVEKMVEGHEGFRAHTDDIVQELEEVNFRNLVDNDLRVEALNVIYPPIPRFHSFST
jgi:hypothetical protein